MSNTTLKEHKTIYSNHNYSYLDAGGLCWYLYKTKNEKRITSSRYINSLDGPKLVEYLKENANLFGDSIMFDSDESSENKSGSDIVKLMKNLDMYDEVGSCCYVFIVEKKLDTMTLTDPIIIKVTIDKDNSYLGASSFNRAELSEAIMFINKKFAKKNDYNNNTFFGILMNNGDSVEVKQLPIDDKFSKNLDMECNYGKQFVDHHKNILEKLDGNRNGLFLFHGSAGTGKTTYIKYLAKHFGGKRMFIFIPTTFIDALTSPNIIPVLLNHPNSVLVLEDAEKAVLSREDNHGNESLVSSLLNIGDGILGSMLNLTIILTFNTARENVDKALLRKGRLHYEHAFEKLSIEDAQSLVDKQKKTFKVTEPMSLAEIYNIEVDNNHKEKHKETIGWKV
jgi:hypothetical protein